MITASSKPTKAFLLAGGLGTRLRPLTASVPKCLLPIQGKPLLQHWLDNLEDAGVSEVILNTHWLAEQVLEFLATYRSDRLRVQTFYEPVLLGSAGTIAANTAWTHDAAEVVIIYADNFTDTRVRDLVTYHRTHAVPVTLGVFRTPTPERCGIVEVDLTGLVTSFIEKPLHPTSDLAAGGMYVADPGIIAEIGKLAAAFPTPFDLGFHVLPRLANQMQIFHVSQNFIDVGTLENYELACRMAL